MALVPLWPFVYAANFIQGGARHVPDYDEIARLEREMRELEDESN